VSGRVKRLAPKIPKTDEKKLCSHSSLLAPYITIHRKRLEDENMSKGSKKQIDVDERMVIADLQKNARESFDKLSERCGCSRQRAGRIIKRLEENNTIWGYHAVVDQSKLDLKRYLVLLKRLPNPMKKEAFDAMVKGKLKGMTEIGVCVDSSFFVHGMYDWVWGVTANNIKQIKQFCEILKRMLSGHLFDIQVLEVLFPVEENGICNPNLEGINDFFLTEDEVSK